MYNLLSPLIKKALLLWFAVLPLGGVTQANLIRTGKIRVHPIVVSRSSRDDFTMRFVDAQCQTAKHIYSQIGLDVEFTNVKILNLDCDTVLPSLEWRPTFEYWIWQTLPTFNTPFCPGMFVSVLDHLVGMKLETLETLERVANEAIADNEVPLFFAYPFIDEDEDNKQVLANGYTNNFASFVWIRCDVSGFTNARTYQKMYWDTAAHEMLHFVLAQNGNYEFLDRHARGGEHLIQPDQLMCPGDVRTSLGSYPHTLFADVQKQSTPIGDLCQIQNSKLIQNGTTIGLIDAIYQSKFVKVEANKVPLEFEFRSSRDLADDDDRPKQLGRFKIAPLGYVELLVSDERPLVLTLTQQSSVEPTALATGTVRAPIRLEYVDIGMRTRLQNADVFQQLGFEPRNESAIVTSEEIDQISLKVELIQVSNISKLEATADFKVSVFFPEKVYDHVHPTDGRQSGRRSAEQLRPSYHSPHLEFHRLTWPLAAALKGYSVKAKPAALQANPVFQTPSVSTWLISDEAEGEMKLSLQCPPSETQHQVPAKEYSFSIGVRLTK